MYGSKSSGLNQATSSYSKSAHSTHISLLALLSLTLVACGGGASDIELVENTDLQPAAAEALPAAPLSAATEQQSTVETDQESTPATTSDTTPDTTQSTGQSTDQNIGQELGQEAPEPSTENVQPIPQSIPQPINQPTTQPTTEPTTQEGLEPFAEQIAQPPVAEPLPATEEEVAPAPEIIVVSNFDAKLIACNAPVEDMAKALLELTNESRAQAQTCGAAGLAATTALQWDDALAAAARTHSLDMTRNNFFSHTGSDGLSVADRATDAGYNWRSIGENIAAGQSSAGNVQADWMDSPGHCKNIMNTGFTHMGASCVEDAGADYAQYWTVVFGRN